MNFGNKFKQIKQEKEKMANSVKLKQETLHEIKMKLNECIFEQDSDYIDDEFRFSLYDDKSDRAIYDLKRILRAITYQSGEIWLTCIDDGGRKEITFKNVKSLTVLKRTVEYMPNFLDAYIEWLQKQNKNYSEIETKCKIALQSFNE